MKKLAVLLLSCLPALGLAAGGYNEHVESAPVNLKDKASMQRGAQLFVNYCMGCHSLQYERYSRLASGLDIPEELVLEHLNFTTDQIGDTMQIAMPKDEAAAWFGAPPPDLTNVARLRTADWVYSYLINFYEDADQPYGFNNRVFENVGMPHVMAAMEEELGEEDFRRAMLDLTNFLAYIGEPVRVDAERIGVYVLVFLFLLWIPAYLLKKEYWKDVH
ncbi:cytochrome c1 [Isoalcanivorax indicus]|uniref:cytochrome c1 n=1 Tax=Isoalcanivorax indicus TaxID=2202653 RepID=UPI000DB94D46|nr:cytochrome c1 [Isoalcanivorax indicus]